MPKCIRDPVVFKIDPRYTRYNKLIDFLVSITGIQWGYVKQRTIIAGISSIEWPIIIDFIRETRSKIPIDIMIAAVDGPGTWHLVQSMKALAELSAASKALAELSAASKALVPPAIAHIGRKLACWRPDGEFGVYIAECERCRKKYGDVRGDVRCDVSNVCVLNPTNDQFLAERAHYLQGCEQAHTHSNSRHVMV